MEKRKKRANGIASRDAILVAAAQIAGERGYEGTSIKAVSNLSGLPASSLYWHFKNKDELIAAVIDWSFSAWLDALRAHDHAGQPVDPQQALVLAFRDSALQLTNFPDFIRLGLMLVLEQRPQEPSARERFRQVRHETVQRIARNLQRAFPALPDTEAARFATFALAGSDGLFIGREAEGLDLVEGFGMLGDAMYALVVAGDWHKQDA